VKGAAPTIACRRGGELTELATEEQRVERDGFGERHADDALHENFRGGSGIATDGFSGFEADEAYANGSAETAEAALNAAGDFGE